MLSSGRELKMIAIADISCDLDGGIEITSRATTIDEPFMYYCGKESEKKYNAFRPPFIFFIPNN